MEGEFGPLGTGLGYAVCGGSPAPWGTIEGQSDPLGTRLSYVLAVGNSVVSFLALRPGGAKFSITPDNSAISAKNSYILQGT